MFLLFGDVYQNIPIHRSITLFLCGPKPSNILGFVHVFKCFMPNYEICAKYLIVSILVMYLAIEGKRLSLIYHKMD